YFQLFSLSSVLLQINSSVASENPPVTSRPVAFITRHTDRTQSLHTLERLTQATGGTEKSWYRCVFPFGVISLVIGMAGTGVTFTFNTLPQTKVVSVALLCTGVVMLIVAAVCWRAHRLRRIRDLCVVEMEFI
uniref:Transmembrane protein 100 n=1 Tax=Fundulus heteroclitus TaxID=8078 RepID=A0A3Q2QUL5_FUNHE